MNRRTLIIGGLLFISGMMAYGEVKLPGIISDNMVVQADRPIPIWGTAAPGEKVVVELAPVDLQGWFRRAVLGHTRTVASTVAGSDGTWKVNLSRLRASNGSATLTVKGSGSPVLTVTNVLVGEVWLCSGQSNMAWPANKVTDADKEMPISSNSQLRQFKVARRTSLTPLADCEGKWELAHSNTFAGFTAVGYFYGRELQQTLKVPVGLINASWGGTPAEAWTSRAALEQDPGLKEMMEKKLAKLAADQASGNTNRPARAESTATCLFNGMISPLIPYAIAGTIWYQGEANANRAVQYRTLFPALITDWRTLWQQGDFPFYYCQLANFKDKDTHPGESDWAELREAQSLTLKLPHTGQAVLIDVGEEADIHPRNKQDVGRRLALIALAETYGRPVEFSGPVYKSMRVQEGKVTLAFSHVGGGLVAKPLPPNYQVKSTSPERKPLVRNAPAGELEGFAVCGADKQWVWAEAVINGDVVVVSSPKVADPVAVRYAWANNPTCNLYNQAGLPAGPFRTDDFTSLTATNK